MRFRQYGQLFHSVGVEKGFQKQHNRVQDLFHNTVVNTVETLNERESCQVYTWLLAVRVQEKSLCRVPAFCKQVNRKSLFLCVGRPVYVSAVRPQSKHIVVIIDHGAPVIETQLQIARDAALIILNSIDEHDKVRK